MYDGRGPCRATLALAQPVRRGVRGDLGATAEVVEVSGDEVGRTAAACVKVQRHGLARGVHRNDDALAAGRALEHELLGLALELVVVTVAERLGTLAREAGGRQGRDPFGEVVPFGRVERRPQLVVAEVLLALDAPLAYNTRVSVNRC